MIDERPVEIVSGPLRLEGRLHEGAGTSAWVVLHPHPQYGGDMDNHVVTTICVALAQGGHSTLRFNFRGTGQSEGVYSGGAGERQDAIAAAGWMRTLRPGKIGIAGYSFGASIAVSVAEEVDAKALVLVSPPTAAGNLRAPRVRTLALVGDRDPVSSSSVIAALASDTFGVTVLPGVDHAWSSGIEELQEQMLAFASV